MWSFKVFLIKRKEIAKDTIELEFDLRKHEFHFQAGQYVRLSIPELLYPDARGNYRDFSICSSPDQKTIKIAMRKSKSGFKRSISQLPIGSEFHVSGPHGEFTLPKDTERPVVLIAGGIGITAFMSQLRFAFKNSLKYEFILFYSNKDPKEAAYLAELEKLAKQSFNFKMVTIFGRVEARHIREKIIDVMDIAKPVWYLAGPSIMVSSTIKLLLAFGVLEDDIHLDEFLGYEPGNSLPSLAAFNRSKILDTTKFHLARANALLMALDKIALVSETDTEGTITYLNEKFVELSKYNREELIGQNHRLLKSGYHSQDFYKKMWDTISRGGVWNGEVKNMAKDGTFYWKETVTAPIIGKNGKPIHYISVGFPITDQKELEEFAAKNKAMLNSIGDGLVMVDLAGNISLVNKAFEDILGWKASEVMGEKFTKKVKMTSKNGKPISEADRLITKTLEKKIYTTASTKVAEIYYKQKNGHRFPVGITVSPVILEGHLIGAVEVFRDNTPEIKKLKTQKHLAVLKETGRIKEDFLNITAHELKNPLVPIKSQLQLLLAEDFGKINQKQQKSLEMVFNNTQRLGALINDITIISKIQSNVLKLAYEKVALKELIQEQVNGLIPKAREKGIKLLFNSVDLPSVSIDRQRITQVILNLLDNAIKFTPADGKVVIEAKKINDTIMVQVTDTGIGIKNTDLNKLFTPFFQIDSSISRRYGGTGLGLSICKGIIDAHGGKINAKSEGPGKGSTFSFTIPVSPVK
jgi:PAS domain S-box-containing protein